MALAPRPPLLSALVLLAALPAASAMAAARPQLLSVARNMLQTRSILVMEDSSSLSAQFAAERARREQAGNIGVPSEEVLDLPEAEPFSGIKEIVLDDAGNPIAIPKRPPPKSFATPQQELKMLITNPLFAFGVLATVGSIVLILAIAGADDAAMPV